jgi:hypothetical protein
MDLTSGMWVGAALFLLLLVPYLAWEIRKGKARGHTWFNFNKERGHRDIGPYLGGPRLTKPGMDEARGARH